MRQLAREIARVVPAPPEGLSPIEWVAVFLVATLVIMLGLFLFWRLPKATKDSAECVARAIDGLAKEIREDRTTSHDDRRAQDRLREEGFNRVHLRFDELARTQTDIRLEVAKVKGEIRRRLPARSASRDPCDDTIEPGAAPATG